MVLGLSSAKWYPSRPSTFCCLWPWSTWFPCLSLDALYQIPSLLTLIVWWVFLIIPDISHWHILTIFHVWLKYSISYFCFTHLLMLGLFKTLSKKTYVYILDPLILESSLSTSLPHISFLAFLYFASALITYMSVVLRWYLFSISFFLICHDL